VQAVRDARIDFPTDCQDSGGLSASIARAVPADQRSARESLAHRVRSSGVLDVEGTDRVAFLQGQLTQDVKALAPGLVLPAAALTPKGKLVFLARVMALPDRLRLLAAADSREPILAHLKKYVIFQNVAIADRSSELTLVGLYGPRAGHVAAPGGAIPLPGEGEFSAEILIPTGGLADLLSVLESAGSALISEEAAEILRVEVGRPRFGRDADASNFADEVGLDAAISTTKGCYVGQEIVARTRTYGRVNRRLVGFLFPDGTIEPGSILKRPEEPSPGKVEQGRVTSAVLSPVFGAIGLGYAFRDVPAGARLVSAADPSRGAVVAALPFSP
jgi:aminomethyltransferase